MHRACNLFLISAFRLCPRKQCWAYIMHCDRARGGNFDWGWRNTSNKAFRLQTPFAAVPPHIRAMWPQMSEGFHIHTQTMRWRIRICLRDANMLVDAMLSHAMKHRQMKHRQSRTSFFNLIRICASMLRRRCCFHTFAAQTMFARHCEWSALTLSSAFLRWIFQHPLSQAAYIFHPLRM